MPNAHIGKRVVGYVVNTGLSQAAQRGVSDVQKLLQKQQSGGLWLAPLSSLHITLLDWIAPLVTYEEQPDVLFQRVFPEYDQTLSRILSACPSITVKFDSLRVSEQAIIITGSDDGSFEAIRGAFASEVELLLNTKRAPRVIHTALARYTSAICLDELVNYASDIEMEIIEPVQSFSLVREEQIPMLRYSLLKTYPIGNGKGH